MPTVAYVAIQPTHVVGGLDSLLIIVHATSHTHTRGRRVGFAANNCSRYDAISHTHTHTHNYYRPVLDLRMGTHYRPVLDLRMGTHTHTHLPQLL